MVESGFFLQDRPPGRNTEDSVREMCPLVPFEEPCPLNCRQGADTILYALLDSDLPSGSFVRPVVEGPAEIERNSWSAAVTAALYETSKQLVQPFISPWQ